MKYSLPALTITAFLLSYIRYLSFYQIILRATAC